MKPLLLTLYCILACSFSFAQSTEKTDSLLHVLQNTSLNEQERAKTLLALGGEYYLSEPAKTEEYAWQALSIARSVNDKHQIAASYQALGLARHMQSDYDSAVSCYLKAEAIYKEVGNPQEMRDIFISLGTSYINLGHYHKALVYLLESLKISENKLDEKAKATSLTNIGLVYDYMNEFDKAITYYNQAIELGEKYNLHTTVRNSYNNLGIIYKTLKEYDKALEYHQKALEKGLAAGNKYGVASSYHNIGILYKNMAQYEEAKAHFLKAFSITQKLGNKRNLAYIYNNLGLLYLTDHLYDSAEFYLLRGFEIAEEQNLLDPQMVISESLSKLHAERGDFETALTYYKAYATLKDSLLNEKKSRQINELQIQYQTEQKEAQITLQQAELQQQKTNNKLILLGFAVFILLILLTFQRFRQKQKLRWLEAQKIKELDRIKSNFFANISHEFRTPLTLIIGSLLKLRKNKTLNADQQEKEYGIMQNNSQHLLQLINQLLELSRLDAGKAQLQAGKVSFIPFLRRICMSFASFAGQKNISIYFNGSTIDTPVSDINVHLYVDIEKMEKVFYNLFSNAVKFTPEGGEIAVDLTLSEHGEKIEISVRNTGPGIPEDKLPYIFDRFYQADAHSTRKYEGTGIGLSLVKELVELHHGSIQVESAENDYTTFTVTLWLGKHHLKPEEIKESHAEEEIEEALILPEADSGKEEAQVGEEILLEETYVLVVEDHYELRQYIKENLPAGYQIIEAENGKKGLEAAIEHIPDLIITDVMMPEMDGFELLQAVRKNEKTSHIPVIMLTARVSVEDKLAGLQIGADEYLVKPFNPEELQVRVSNLIRIRKELQQKYSQELLLQPKSIKVDSAQSKFMDKVLQTLEMHLSDEYFGVEALGQEIGMSRAQTHRKLKALINQSPSELIRNFRLQRAADLIKNEAGNMAEIAYQVGFSSQAYFTRSFQEYYQCTPSEYKRKNVTKVQE